MRNGWVLIIRLGSVPYPNIFLRRYIDWLEDQGLADVVPHMEPHYMNPSPWLEKEQYEIEFNEIMADVSEN